MDESRAKTAQKLRLHKPEDTVVYDKRDRSIEDKKKHIKLID